MTRTKEAWRWVLDWEGLYLISNFGRVSSIPRGMSNGGLLNPFEAKGGYLRVDLTDGGKSGGRRSKKLVHVLVLEAFVCPRPPGLETRHLDGDPTNNALENLCWGTTKENNEDRKKHGKRKGHVAPNRKVHAKMISHVKKGLGVGLTGRELARCHGVSEQTISQIKRGRYDYILDEGRGLSTIRNKA